MTEPKAPQPRPHALTSGFLWVTLPLLALLGYVGYLPMTWQQQAYCGAIMVLVAILAGKFHRGRAGTLVMVMLSMCATTRYAVWRISSLERYLTNPWQSVDVWNAIFMLLLLGAEVYSFVILYLGYMQTIAPLRRPPLPLPESSEQWPTIDLMVPTFNEPLDVVRYTILAAKQLDWPTEKLKVWLLDDGDREEFRNFAKEAGVEYVARPEHSHAKAGNINYTLARSTGDLVAIFDCDHVPTRSFLQMTAGWFLRDERLAMLQTPHHFYSPDPFERNLGNFGHVPNEGELFYGVIQDTNDFWNATFFCGSCAVLRRTAIEEVGGIAVETVTEDAHTSLRMQKLGWNTAYINLTQAAGLATETLADHVKQRIRWARGMAQILRVDNPLLSRKLRLSQRLCYLNAMLHFMYALPRLIFLSSPILYLVFGKLNIPAYWLTILVFATPHLLLSMMTNSRVQGMKRYSFWNEIYETVLSPYILLPTLLALVSPKLGKFNVTNKGQNQLEDYFDTKLARPFLVLLLANVLALMMAVPRILYWDRGHTGTIVMNVIWTVFNIVVLGATLSVCWESRQRRHAVRVRVKIPVSIEGGEVVSAGHLEDISIRGASAVCSGRWRINDSVRLSFPNDDADAVFSARVVGATQNRVRLAFEIDTVEQQEAITRVLYMKADRWLYWTDGRRPDNIVKSLFAVIATAATAMRFLFKRQPDEPKSVGRVLAARTVVGVLVMIAALFFFLHNAHGEVAAQKQLQPVDDGAALNVNFALSSLGANNGVLLDRYDRSQGLKISLPNDVLLTHGALHLKYALPQSSDPTSTLEVLLNDTVLAAITPTADELAAGKGEVSIPLPVELLVRQNRLTMRLADAGGGACSITQMPTAPIRIEPDSWFAFQELRLVLASDLSLLPEPFVQRSATQGTRLPVVFAHQPAPRTLEAAGVLASWFGTQAQTGQADYAVRVGSLPKGNAVVMLSGNETLPQLQANSGGRGSIFMVTNPQDPYGKLLVFSADSPDDLLSLTQALALGQLQLSGDRSSLGRLALPAPRAPDDAPRWIHTSRVGLEALNGGNAFHTTDSNPWNMYLRFSPDYDYGADRQIYLHLEYGNDATALAPASNLVVRLNGSPADSVAVRPMSGSNSLQRTNLSLATLPASVFANTLQVQFYFVPPAGQECGSTHFAGTLGGGSYLDLGKPVHLAKLPNLHLFSVAGFPFTRMADLSETAILFPADATPEELSLYLDLMNYFGSQTGYPTLRVNVGTLGQADRFRDKDLLMLGTYADLRNAPSVASKLPLQLREDGWQLTARARVVDTVRSWEHSVESLFSQQQEPAAIQNVVPEGMLQQIVSPYAGRRSVVLVLGKDNQTLQAMTAGLMTDLPQDHIKGDVSLWQNGAFISHYYNAPAYYLGDATLLTRISRIIPHYPWIFVLGLTACLILMALWLDACINQRIRKRLHGVEFDLDGKPVVPAS